MKDLKNTKDLEAVLSHFMSVVGEVPFGNSDYQNRQAIVNDERTPMRAYRHAALRITNRLHALMEANYNIRKSDIEIKIMEAKAKAEADPLQKQLIELDIEQKRMMAPYTRKLIADAIREIESLYPVIESLGKVTREQFELEEKPHFDKTDKLPHTNGTDLYGAITGNEQRYFNSSEKEETFSSATRGVFSQL